MATARRRESWDHTAWTCCVIANHAFGQRRARRPREFDAMRLASAPVRKLSPAASLDALAALGGNK